MSILSKNYLYFEVILSRYTEKQSNYKILKFRVYLKTLKWCVFDIKYFNLTIHFYLGQYATSKYPLLFSYQWKSNKCLNLMLHIDVQSLCISEYGFKISNNLHFLLLFFNLRMSNYT